MICCTSMVVLATLVATGAAPSVLSVGLVESFDEAEFREPASVLWPGSFWCWNGPLDPEVLRGQLRDMAAHDLRSVCMLPLPHAFRPENTNNQMAPDYLTPEYMGRVRIAVDESARLGMFWWLYDEGGWPSGSAVGRVTEGHREFGQHRLVRERVKQTEPYRVPDDAVVLVVEKPSRAVIHPGETWTPQPESEAYLYRDSAGGYADMLNPEATRRFIELTHEAYQRVVGNAFGKTIQFTFTDEPNAPNLDPPRSIPWTPGFDKLYAERFGWNLFDVLPLLYTLPSRDMPPETARARIELYDLWTGRFRDAYFSTLRDWCRGAGLASGGHLNGEDETVNAVRYGFGQALRQLRGMDVPGVDSIWRQIFPGKPNQHFFPKYASSASHQNGTRFSFTESFCVYGNGLTPEQMKWITDYQYVRGINLLVAGCFPLSTRDHLMTGERPHYGPSDPLWDHLPGYFGYVARTGYALSVGTPKIATALYYPVRDLWAWGENATEAVQTHDALAQELLSRQCDFDLIDDDLLAEPGTHIEKGVMCAGAMRYSTIICGDVRWMEPRALERLEQLAAAGGTVISIGHVPGTDGSTGPENKAFHVIAEPREIGPVVTPLVKLEPPSRDIRVAGRAVPRGEVLFLFNEGQSPYAGSFDYSLGHVYRLDAHEGVVYDAARIGNRVPVALGNGESVVLLLSDAVRPAKPCYAATEDVIDVTDRLQARPRRQFVVGEHDYEVVEPKKDAVPFAAGARWRSWLGEDFSGEVEYRGELEIPASWGESAITVETGPIEYAVTVLLDGKVVDRLLWPPWRAQLPACAPGRHEIVIRVANTLANELTSERVAHEWDAKSGPGWPSPYHKRAIEFEKESRGGGIAGPVILRRNSRPQI